jgi:hypothetical protein
MCFLWSCWCVDQYPWRTWTNLMTIVTNYVPHKQDPSWPLLYEVSILSLFVFLTCLLTFLKLICLLFFKIKKVNTNLVSRNFLVAKYNRWYVNTINHIFIGRKISLFWLKINRKTNLFCIWLEITLGIIYCLKLNWFARKTHFLWWSANILSYSDLQILTLHPKKKQRIDL